MLNKTIILLVSVLSCISGFSQVKLHGEVIHRGKPLDRVTIQVYEKGKLQRTIAVTKKGQYETEFPTEHDYILVFRRPFMIPVRIAVNTSFDPNEKDEEIGYDVPLNMEMYYRFEELDATAYEEPIGVVKCSGKGENTFSFHPDEKRIEEIKAVNERSLAMEDEGKKPLDRDDKGEAMTTDKAATPADVSGDAKPTEASGGGHDESNEINTHELEQKLKLEREADRYDQIEKARMERLAQDRELQMKSHTVDSDRDDEQENYIMESKAVRSETTQERNHQEEKTVDAKVAKQEHLANELEEAARVKTTSTRSVTDDSSYGISIKKDSGWFYTEEILDVSECGVRNRYKHTTYHWLLFDVEYYYMNDSEISKETYEVAKDLFK